MSNKISSGPTLPPVLSWVQRQRLEYIEFCLYWLGRVNRAELKQRFQISENQSSLDLNAYIALAPNNLSYDKSAKTYVLAPTFAPVFGPLSAGPYLSELRRLAETGDAATDSWIAAPPPLALTDLPLRHVDTEILRIVLAAIRERRALHISYQSMSSLEPAARVIEPHALGFDGYRWHVRAFDCKHAKNNDRDNFADFVLARISSAALGSAAQSEPQRDTAWHEYVEVHLAPHSGLSPSQARAIAMDYGMDAENPARGTLFRMRRAMLWYVVRQLSLDILPDARAPQTQQIILRNREILQLLNDRPAGANKSATTA